MAIMKLSNVPELNEFAGTEKIYVNDNGETKQIACDKVVTAGGGGGGNERIILDLDNQNFNAEDVVVMAENGDDVWVKQYGMLSKVIGYDWSTSCGGRYFTAAYVSGTTIKKTMIGIIGSDLYGRLDNIPTL